MDRPAKLLVTGWVIAVLLGAMHAWISRHVMSMDGVCYIDMGEAYLRGDWDTAINGLWSPLYSWLIGAAFLVLQPDPLWEFPVVHLVNFLTYLLSLTGFHFLLRELLRDRQAFLQGHTGILPLPEWAWIALGYSFFIWSSLTMTTVRDPTPDLCVSACVYLAFGLVLKIRRGTDKKWVFAGLGLVLGLGYLSKAVMFPLAFVFLTVAFFVQPASIKLARTGLAALVFLAVAAPMIAALSKARGRLTFSDAGKLNYAWHVNGVPSIYWNGGPEGSGQPVHGVRKILDDPPVFEFAAPIGGTHPAWYDPSYWYEGLQVNFNWRNQAAAFARGAVDLYTVFVRWMGTVVAIIVILCMMSNSVRTCTKSFINQWALWFPSAMALGLYAAIHVEWRYIGPFVVVIFLAAFASVRLPGSPHSRKLLATGTAVIAAVMAVKIISATVRIISKQSSYANQQAYSVARDLENFGIRPGGRVAHFGFTSPVWARTARVKIAAQMVWRKQGDDQKFWTLPEARKQKLYDALRNIGIQLIVAQSGAEPGAGKGWQRLARSGRWVYPLAPPESVHDRTSQGEF